MLKRVDYLSKMPSEIQQDLIFSLITLTFAKRDYVLHVGETVEQVYLIEEGVVKVLTMFEGNKFIIDELGPGSVINHRSFFIKD